MTPPSWQLGALTCQTIPAPPLTASAIDGTAQASISAPLGSKVSCPVPDEEMRQQIGTVLQLLAATQAMRYPWLTLNGLFRVIVAPDRRAAVMANASLLEAIGQPVAEHLKNKSAFAFPCDQGVVVILPLEIVRCAVAPDSETERQYGLTTIWHEFAHVKALTLQYFHEGKMQRPIRLSVSNWVNQAWHEFFADRHSHWPGFSTALEEALVVQSWQALLHGPTASAAKQILVRLASAYGRHAADDSNQDSFVRQFPMIFSTPLIISMWEACAKELEKACSFVQANDSSPNLSRLEQVMEQLSVHLTMEQL